MFRAWLPVQPLRVSFHFLATSPELGNEKLLPEYKTPRDVAFADTEVPCFLQALLDGPNICWRYLDVDVDNWLCEEVRNRSAAHVLDHDNRKTGQKCFEGGFIVGELKSPGWIGIRKGDLGRHVETECSLEEVVC